MYSILCVGPARFVGCSQNPHAPSHLRTLPYSQPTPRVMVPSAASHRYTRSTRSQASMPCAALLLAHTPSRRRKRGLKLLLNQTERVAHSHSQHALLEHCHNHLSAQPPCLTSLECYPSLTSSHRVRRQIWAPNRASNARRRARPLMPNAGPSSTFTRCPVLRGSAADT